MTCCKNMFDKPPAPLTPPTTPTTPCSGFRYRQFVMNQSVKETPKSPQETFQAEGFEQVHKSEPTCTPISSSQMIE